MTFILMLVMVGQVEMQEFDNYESCDFAGQSFMAIAYEVGHRSRLYKCVPKDKTKWFKKSEASKLEAGNE